MHHRHQDSIHQNQYVDKDLKLLRVYEHFHFSRRFLVHFASFHHLFTVFFLNAFAIISVFQFSPRNVVFFTYFNII